LFLHPETPLLSRHDIDVFFPYLLRNKC
jgi:hypothetical protein